MRDATFYALFIGLIAWSFWDGQIVRFEAVSYLGMYAVYVLYLKFDNAKMNKANEGMIESVAEETQHLEEEAESRLPFLKIFDTIIAATYPKIENIPSKTRYTFWMSIAWIVFLSWILVESGVLLASSLGVSEVIIGLTVLAAGTSVPDLFSSLIVAKQGRGDMAVANALGSNIFDIGICLGLPWIVYLAMTGAPVPVSNGDLTISIGTLFAVLVLVVGTFAITNFRINKKVGYVFI